MTIDGIYFKPGTWNAQCWLCGFEYKADQLRRNWEGRHVCGKCWEPRHPQDYVRAPRKEKAPGWTQPTGAEHDTLICTPNGCCAIPEYVVPGCVVPGYVHPAFNGDL